MEIDLPDGARRGDRAVPALREGAGDERRRGARRAVPQRQRTLRYGIGENLYGYDEITAFRAGAFAGRADAQDRQAR